MLGEELGENAAYNQPKRLRRHILVGKLKIKHTEGHTLAVKQHPEYQLVIKIIKEREQQRVAREGTSGRKSRKQNASPSSSS